MQLRDKACIVLDTLSMGIPVLLPSGYWMMLTEGRVGYAAFRGNESIATPFIGDKCLDALPEEADCIIGSDMSFLHFYKECQTLSVEDISLLVADIVLNKERLEKLERMRRKSDV